ncbi:MAG: PPK2 family polyphosphate kinase [Pauljensenia sp.]
MGEKKRRKQAAAEEKARNAAIERARRAGTEARDARENARSGKKGHSGKSGKSRRTGATTGNGVTGAWSSDPRELLRVGPQFDLADLSRDSTPGWDQGRRAAEKWTATRSEFLSQLQERLYASSRGGAQDSVLLVLQGLDTSGKGGIVRHVVGQVDPQGIELAAFKAPTEEERQHDFLWRVRPRLPRPGHIGVFDRSHYEDLLVPTAQALTGRRDEHGESWVVDTEELNRRYHDIYEMELAATQSGMRIVKVCLMVSYEEQGLRLRERLDRSDKHWKFSTNDLDTRDDWVHFQAAYAEVLSRTSTEIAPWYVVPADRKWYSRLAVTEILTRTLAGIDPTWPAATFDVEAARTRLDATLTPTALRKWAREKEAVQEEWITADESVSLAVDELNAASRLDATRSLTQQDHEAGNAPTS